MTDAELEALATEILMEANNEKWYEQKARIVAALRQVFAAGQVCGTHYPLEVSQGSPLVYTGLGHVPRDFMPGRHSYEEG